jgi:hypothetical protein
MHDPDAVIAERTLKRCDDGATVVVKVFKPVPDPEEPDSTWACGFEITGLDETIRDRALGVDAMQALMLSFHAILGEFKKSDAPVAFLSDTPGDTGFYRFYLDPDMEALIGHLAEAEFIRQNTIYDLLDKRAPATDQLLEHVKNAEAIRQKILRRILERAMKQRG